MGLTQILLLWFILGYCDVAREISTKRTESVSIFEVNDSEELVAPRTSNQMPPKKTSALVEALKDVSKNVSDGLQRKKKVHGFEYS